MAIAKHDEIEALTEEEARAIYAPCMEISCDAFRRKISYLRTKAPQVLHIEGGSLEQRVAFAHYWSALHICQNLQEASHILGIPQELSYLMPCTQCPDCYKVAAHMHADALFYAKEIENRRPPTKNIDVETIRNLKVQAQELPRFAPKKMIALLEGSDLRTESANTLLKVLEEPSKHTHFVFTTSQRERLLPTLISRGFVLTLPWLDAKKRNKLEKEWEQILTKFFKNGSELFAITAQKGSIDAHKAQTIIGLLQKSFARAITTHIKFVPNTTQITENIQNNSTHNDIDSLSALFQNTNEEVFFKADEIIAETLEALEYQTNITYALESLLSKLFVLFKVG